MGNESNGQRFLSALKIILPVAVPWIWSDLDGIYQAELQMAATEYDRATAERVTELENELAKGKRLITEAVDLADKTCTEFEQCAAENCALRERLAKLETAARAAGESLQGCTLSHPDGITVALLRLEELRELVTP